jgi:hypothetical protein
VRAGRVVCAGAGQVLRPVEGVVGSIGGKKLGAHRAHMQAPVRTLHDAAHWPLDSRPPKLAPTNDSAWRTTRLMQAHARRLCCRGLREA